MRKSSHWLSLVTRLDNELLRDGNDGRERAKAKGVRLGRKPKLTEHQRKEGSAGATRARSRWPRSAAATTERMDDREARAMTRKTLFGTPPAKRAKRRPPGMVCDRRARRPRIPSPHVENDGGFFESARRGVP